MTVGECERLLRAVREVDVELSSLRDCAAMFCEVVGDRTLVFGGEYGDADRPFVGVLAKPPELAREINDEFEKSERNDAGPDEDWVNPILTRRYRAVIGLDRVTEFRHEMLQSLGMNLSEFAPRSEERSRERLGWRDCTAVDDAAWERLSATPGHSPERDAFFARHRGIAHGVCLPRVVRQAKASDLVGAFGRSIEEERPQPPLEQFERGGKKAGHAIPRTDIHIQGVADRAGQYLGRTVQHVERLRRRVCVLRGRLDGLPLEAFSALGAKDETPWPTWLRQHLLRRLSFGDPIDPGESRTIPTSAMRFCEWLLDEGGGGREFEKRLSELGGRSAIARDDAATLLELVRAEEARPGIRIPSLVPRDFHPLWEYLDAVNSDPGRACPIRPQHRPALRWLLQQKDQAADVRDLGRHAEPSWRSSKSENWHTGWESLNAGFQRAVEAEPTLRGRYAIGKTRKSGEDHGKVRIEFLMNS